MPDPLPAGTPARRPAAPGARRFAAAALTLALAGAAVGVGSWVRPLPAPYFVPLWVTQYRSRAVPDRSETDADRAAVQAAGFFTRLANSDSSQEGLLLTREIDQLQRLGPNENLVLYLSGFARVRGGGDVEFIPADADPPGGREGLSLRDVLRKVKAAAPRAKLVVLDLAGPPPDPRIGYLWTDPTAHVPALVAAVEAEHRAAHPAARPDWLVLCSASPGQTPFGNRVLGRSVFGYYFETGLRGAAVPYDPSGRVGRRVTVRGLAAFLRSRVDRWVRENEGRRQIPALLGDGPDFDLVSAAGGDTPTPGVAPDGPVLGGWDALARWRSDGGLSAAPRVYVRLQDELQVAQAGRRFGAADDRGFGDLATDLGRFDREMAAARAAPKRPVKVVSLALARVFGAADDPAAGEATDALLAAGRDAAALAPAGREAAVAKAVAGFVTATEGKPPFAVEAAVVARGQIAAARPADLLLLDRALAERKVPLAHIEAYFLRRLAELARRAPADQWPAEVARAGFAAVTAYEAAAARPDAHPWTAAVLKQAAEARWVGEILLQFWGSVPPGEPVERFRDAVRLSSAATAFADAHAGGRAAADEAVAGLVPESTVLEDFPDRVPLWKARLRATGDLLKLLVPPAAPLDATGLLEQADQLRRAAAATGGLTAAIDQVTGTADVDWAVAAAAVEPPPAALIRKIDFLFSLPRLSPARRAALNRAGLDLTRRLAERTLAADRADDAAGHRTPVVLYGTEDATADRRATAARAAVRAECSIAILRFAGLPAATLEPLDTLLEAARRGGPDGPAWVDLSAGLGRAWGDGLDDLARDAPAPALDVLAVLAPAYMPSRYDATGAEPRVAARRAAWAEFFGWSGVVHRQVARAGFDRDFLEAVASAELAVGTDATVPPPLMTFDDPPPLVLTAAGPAEVRLAVRHPGGAVGEPIAVRALPPGDAVRVTAETTPFTPDPAGGGTLGTLVVRAEVANPASPGRIPEGVVIEFRSGQRTAFVAVAIDGTRLVNPVEIVVGRSPIDPVGIGDDVRVRPGAGEALYVFVRNRGTAKREVVVRAVPPLAGAPAIEAKVAVGPGETRAVPFAGAAPPAGKLPTAAPAFDLPGVLRVEVADAADPATVVQSRTLRLSVSEPFEYVELSAATFEPVAPPARPENRLAVTVRALRDLGATPSVAALVVDPSGVPGLRGIRAGRFAGRVPANGGPVTLDATGLVLDPEARRRGQVSVTVDGVTRAFRLGVDFARTGDPVSPTVDAAPNLELRAAPSPTPGKSVAFHIGADRAPPGATLDARLVRSEAGREPTDEATRALPASRRRTATVAPGPDGGLHLAAAITDWEVAWDVPQLVGRRMVVARLLAADKTVLATKELAVVLDDSPPTAPEFRGLPEQVKKGAALPVTVEVTDPESGVASVALFVGKPGPDGKPPAGTTMIPAVRSPSDPARWSAVLPLPRDKLGTVDVSCVAVNGAGLASSGFAAVEAVEALPEKPAAIAGQLREGTRPQAGLDVTLSDARGTALFKATTDADGKFLFPDLKPGAYTLTAEKVATRRRATATATATAGATTTADLNLYLSP
ncbi:carboxypeptidase regulatory-like domain-containing protein [Gemmata sp.]|uniref:carboxypeptidase regulatory-like domain-containing protein n=1 Tax=Gemmata sp. TaxID=1914242 RepID=UPI003F6E49B5